MTNYRWSLNDEDFNYESLNEAVDGWEDDLGGNPAEVGDIIYRGEIAEPMTQFINADMFIKEVRNIVYDNYGERAEGFPVASPEAKKELQDFISQWQEKYCKPSFFKVKNTVDYALTEQDIADYKKWSAES